MQRVVSKYDQGAVVKLARVEILSNDTPESLQRRVLHFEHQIQKELLKDFAKGNINDIPKVMLVKPEEEQILIQAKRMAIKLYPGNFI